MVREMVQDAVRGVVRVRDLVLETVRDVVREAVWDVVREAVREKWCGRGGASLCSSMAISSS